MIHSTMAESGPQNRRHLVAQVYASMTETELRELAVEAWSLTEIGKEELRAELTRRALDVELAQSPAKDEEISNFVIVRRCRDLPEADLAKSFLESAGIKSFLRDHNTIGVNWGLSYALGGIKLCVNSEDADTAAQLLGQEIPERFDVEGIGEYKQPRCPNCNSLDISLRDWNRTYAGLVLGAGPLTGGGHSWLCHSCNFEWPEPDSVSGQDSQPK
jgi:hypothetical protein